MRVTVSLSFVSVSHVARALNDWENHRTMSEYEDALITKIFAFRFMNAYSSLFYTGFIKKYDLGCPGEDGCLGELRSQLGSMFVTMIGMNDSKEAKGTHRFCFVPPSRIKLYRVIWSIWWWCCPNNKLQIQVKTTIS